MITIIFAGVDIGSTTTKCVLVDEHNNMLTFKIIFTGFDRNASGEEVLEMALEEIDKPVEDVAYIVSTGYGRKAFSRADKNIPEIIAHALGTTPFYDGARTIIDIGGQDSKVIELDENGMVTRFEMNDKCAAGTGRFFEVLAGRLLGVDMGDLSDLIMKSQNPCVISSMCTIFAESEIISYLSQGVAKEDIVAGMSRSIVRRVIGMGRAGQMKFVEPIVISGGVAQNQGIVNEFMSQLDKKITAISIPQSTAALGAAISAVKEYKKECDRDV